MKKAIRWVGSQLVNVVTGAISGIGLLISAAAVLRMNGEGIALSALLFVPTASFFKNVVFEFCKFRPVTFCASAVLAPVALALTFSSVVNKWQQHTERNYSEPTPITQTFNNTARADQGKTIEFHAAKAAPQHQHKQKPGH